MSGEKTPENGYAVPSGDVEHTSELRSRDWWVNWVLAVPFDDGEPDFDATATKQPVAPYDRGHARPVRWHAGLDDDEHPSTSFAEVVEWDGLSVGTDIEASERVLSDELGIGVIIPVGGGEGEPITLLDWDDVRDPETGAIHPVCAEALAECGGFAEISQSGEGIHQFVFGEIPGGLKKFLRHIDDEPFVGDSMPMLEMYSSGRLTAMTGDHVAGMGDDIVDGQDLIDDLCWEFGTADNNSPGTPTDPYNRRDDIDDRDTPSHDAVGDELREAVAYDGPDPADWDIPDDEPFEYHAVLRAREREPEMVNTANWELLGYAAAIAVDAGISKEQLLEDLRAHDRPGYEFDESKARKEIRGVWRKAKAGNYEPPSLETLRERGIIPESFNQQDGASGIISLSSLDRHNGGYGYFHSEEDGASWFERVTNFEIDVDSFLFKDGERLIDATVIPSSGEEAYDITIPAKVFNDARTFRDNVVTGLTTTFDGAPSDLNELRKLVGGQSAPVRTGTHHMGLHPDESELVAPDGVLTADGWTDDPEMSYIEREIAAERAFELSPDTHNAYNEDDVADILELLPQTRNAERFLPVLGWLYAAPLRPYVQQWEGQFNTLHVTGETGAGKSSTLSVAWQLLGMNGDPMACDDTKFALTTAMASTNSIPMWFDEYKPGDMKDWELDRFQTLMRKSTRGGVETRGNADKSTEEYRLAAPLMISGEQAVQGAAEERRSIQTRFLDNVKESGSPTRQAFAELTGTAYETGNGTREPEGYDLQQHALAYYQFILENDADHFKRMWRRSREHVRDLLETYGITGVDDLPRQGLQTVHFGLMLYRQFAESVGTEAVPAPSEGDDALLYIARQFGDGGNRKSHLDRFIELTSRAAAEGYIESGKHYTVVKQGTPEEEVAMKLSRTFDAVSKYARDYALDGEDMLNTATDYRERFREAADKSESYVTAHSKLSRPLNRCVRIDTDVAAEQLEFDPAAFGAEGDGADDDTEQSGGATLTQLPPGRHTLEVTIAEQLEPKPWQQGRGHVVDDGEILTYIAEGQSDPLDDVEEGDRVRIRNAKIAVGRDGMKRLEVSGVCDVEVLPSVDTEQSNVADAATDGGEAEAVQIKERVIDALENDYGPGADVTVPNMAGALGASPGDVGDALDTVASETSLLERLDGDGEYRRL